MTKNILMDCSLEVSIWDYEKNSGSHFLGGVRMNLGSGYYQGNPCDWMDALDKELYIWKKMIKNPGHSIKDTLPLRERFSFLSSFTYTSFHFSLASKDVVRIHAVSTI